MGLLSSLKSLFSKDKKLNPGQQEERSYTGNSFTNSEFPASSIGVRVQGKAPGEAIYLREAQDTGKHFLYQDGQKTTILTAYIYRHDENSSNAFMFEGGLPICLEVPVGTTIEQLEQSGWLQYMLNSDKAQEDQLSPVKYTHIGRYDARNNALVDSYKGVDEWIENNLNKQMRERIENERRAYEAKQAEERAREQAKWDATPRYDYKAAEREENKNNPKFEISPDGAYELNSLQTGMVLRMQLMGSVPKIRHRDGSIDYIYSAYMEEREGITDTIYFNQPIAPNVQFSLPRPIDEMLELANERNPDGSLTQNAIGVARMMEQLVEMPKYGNSIFTGAIKEQDGRFVFGDERNTERTLQLMNQSGQRNNPQQSRQSQQYDR